jgi:hypothetical protein
MLPAEDARQFGQRAAQPIPPSTVWERSVESFTVGGSRGIAGERSHARSCVWRETPKQLLDHRRLWWSLLPLSPTALAASVVKSGL